MRISDWSSDVCSSDLGSPLDAGRGTINHTARQCRRAAKLVCGFQKRHARAGITSRDGGCHPGPSAANHDYIIVVGHVCSRSEEHTSELQSLMRISYAVFCLKKKNHNTTTQPNSTSKQKQT